MRGNVGGVAALMAGEGWVVKDLERVWRFPNRQRNSNSSPKPLVPKWSPGEEEAYFMRICYILLSEEVQTRLAAQNLPALASGPGIWTGVS